jgi:hypothetical protein
VSAKILSHSSLNKNVRKNYRRKGLLLALKRKVSFVCNEEIGPTATGENTQEDENIVPKKDEEDTVVMWRPEKNGWKPLGDPPECESPIISQTPVNIDLATSILYPGQIRGGDYKPHGGFRFDNSNNDDIQVVVPKTGYVFRGSRYLANGEIQYYFDIMDPCGIMYRIGHLLKLSQKFTLIAENFREPVEGDSRSTEITPIKVETGEVMATAVGFEKQKNVFMDFGVYDLRQKNKAAQDASWLSKHSGEQAPYALCWLNILPSPDREKALSLPGSDYKSGKESDYC